MIEYSPFLKIKNGEISALINLTKENRSIIVPLLELPRDDKYTEETLLRKIDQNAKKMEKNIRTSFSFYIDNYEISDDLNINGNDNYLYLLQAFQNYDIIPVIGLDRTDIHNSLSIQFARTRSKKIAFRITDEYFYSFLAYTKKYEVLFSEIDKDFICTILIDCRYIDDKNIINLEKNLFYFLDIIIKKKKFSKIVYSGSSIPSLIVEKVKVDSNVDIIRNEVELFLKIKRKYPKTNFIFGDYTVISPGYSEISIDPKLFLNVMTSKIIYSQLKTQYFTRGRSIKQYGFDQYFSQAKDIISKYFYRGKEFSWGDKYLFDKANYGGANITPATIIGPTVNAHIAFMIDEISKGSL